MVLIRRVVNKVPRFNSFDLRPVEMSVLADDEIRFTVEDNKQLLFGVRVREMRRVPGTENGNVTT
jgi:hypothetical protein